MIGLPICGTRMFRREKNREVTHVFKKEVICYIALTEERGISLGTILTTSDKKRRGVVIELDDATILDDFILVWWSDGDKYGKRHTLEEIESGKLVFCRD